ncbi:Kinase [Sergentomyia squamirostris]
MRKSGPSKTPHHYHSQRSQPTDTNNLRELIVRTKVKNYSVQRRVSISGSVSLPIKESDESEVQRSDDEMTANELCSGLTSAHIWAEGPGGSGAGVGGSSVSHGGVHMWAEARQCCRQPRRLVELDSGADKASVGRSHGKAVDVRVSCFNAGESVEQKTIISQRATAETDSELSETVASRRQRKIGVYRRDFPRSIDEETSSDIKYPCVERLIQLYTAMIHKRQEEMTPEMLLQQTSKKIGKTTKEIEVETSERGALNQSPFSDEGCSTHQSPYSSDDDETKTGGRGKRRDKVVRSSSSDSALGLDDDHEPPVNPVRRMTLTVSDIPLRPALLPLAEPAFLNCCENPAVALSTDTTTHNVPSKMILEAQVIEIPANMPEDPATEASISRRESAQSFLSDVDEGHTVRYVRTPSVVVSDYSDDIMCGITLEEIEYFRRQQRRRSSGDGADGDAFSDVSAASSCSNLNYCGSHISTLDGCEYSNLRMPERKISDCSTCSTISGDEEESYQAPKRDKKVSDANRA